MHVETVHQLQQVVKARRQELGETQAVTAKRARVSRKWLSEFERGATLAVELPQLLRILSSLSLRIDIVEAPPEHTTSLPQADGGQDLDRLLNQYLGISDDARGE